MTPTQKKDPMSLKRSLQRKSKEKRKHRSLSWSILWMGRGFWLPFKAASRSGPLRCQILAVAWSFIKSLLKTEPRMLGAERMRQPFPATST